RSTSNGFIRTSAAGKGQLELCWSIALEIASRFFASGEAIAGKSKRVVQLEGAAGVVGLARCCAERQEAQAVRTRSDLALDRGADADDVIRTQLVLLAVRFQRAGAAQGDVDLFLAQLLWALGEHL